MDLSVEEALSNSLILRNIFSFLNEKDLERCCHVSQFWRKVADPLVFSHFEIQLGPRVYFGPVSEDNRNYYEHDHGADLLGSEYIMIKESVRYNRKKSTFYRGLKFLDITRVLEKVLRAHKVSISLLIRAVIDDQKKSMEKFLSKFGPLVHDLDFDEVDPLPLNKFCKLLLNCLPNLRELNCTKLRFKEDSPEDQNFNQDLPQNKHKHLRKITFKESPSFSVQSFVPILKVASNLNEIQHLPIELVDALEVAGKGQLLKSLNYDYNWYFFAEGHIPYFQTLARLKPKLNSFYLLKNSLQVENVDFFERIKPLIFSVLESSSETLETLHIPSTGWRGYESLPRMEALLKLEFGQLDDKCEGLIFPANISLTESFPNVRELNFSDNEMGEILNRLPEIIPWESRIKTLRVDFLSLVALLILQARFPSIEEFQFSGTSNVVGEIFPSLALWPCLKSLEIRMYCDDPDYEIPQKLDCTLTGLSEGVLDQLRDSSRRGNFTDEEIQGFKDESPMSKFKELRFFKLVFTDSDDVLGLSPLANEFGFKLLSHLRVTLEIPQIDDDVEEAVPRALEPFDHRDNIKIIY